MIDNSLYLRKCVRYQGVHWCHRKYGRISRDKIGLSCIASVKTNTYQKLPNIWLWTSSIKRRVPVFKSEHDENWKYLPAIRRYWFDDIDLMIFQIVFFYFILGQNFLVHSSLASRKKTFTHPKQQNDAILTWILHSVWRLQKIICLYNRVFPVSAEKYLSTWTHSYIIPKQLTPSPVNPWRQVQLNEPTVLLQCAMPSQLWFCSWHSSKSAKIILDDVSTCVRLLCLSHLILLLLLSVCRVVRPTIFPSKRV